MTVLLVLLFLSGLFELAIVRLPISVVQKILAVAVGSLILSVSFGLILRNLAAWTIVLAFFSLFRIVNLLRLIDGRKQANYLRAAFISTSLQLLLYQLLTTLLAYLAKQIGLSYEAKWVLLAGLQLAGVIVISLSLHRNFKKTRPLKLTKFIADKDLPTVTVAIPARNETKDLDDCLRSIVKSDYPKLEVLVLDDCSQNKRTPEIIRQFAHDGVRFLSGKVPPDAWTAKNYAYEQLAEEANGQVLLFCGVDVRFEPTTIRKMIELKVVKRKTMMSFIPSNRPRSLDKLELLAIQPCRYFWELGLPRRKFNRPPVLSTCWLIDKASLKADGGFKAVSRNILPERYFARQTVRRTDGYSFVQSDRTVGLTCQKSFDEQYSTAVRTRYPVLKQKLEYASLVTLIETVLFLLPVFMFVVELIEQNYLISITSLSCLIILSYDFYKVVGLTYRAKFSYSLLCLPLIAFYDIYLLLNSTWQYEFNEVIWKGRNVCEPVMFVTKHLPKV